MTREMLFPIEREEGSTLQTQICDALSRAISSKLSRSDIGFANTFERAVNGGVKACHLGGAKVGHLVPRLGA